jgi:aspartyl-tRNA(Asn)/glutamyl-tRNA(Gln) amidotransferase subunit A
MTAGADLDLAFAGAAEQARRVQRGEVSSRELTELYLARIAAREALGAYLHVDREGALARADEIDRAIAAGQDPGPLAGVPIALKDILVTEGMVTTAASRILDGWVPPYDGTAVARLRAAGAVILGKLNMDEFAMGSSNEHSARFPCKNPWDETRVAGGSSGGSAAAVAAGLCAGSLGTDTGGSIRQPASFCGAVGLKPTYGRVSRYGVIAFASSLDQVGPIARNVEDAALLLELIAGHDPRDATSIDAEVPRYRDALAGGIKGLKIGIPDEFSASHLGAAHLGATIDPEVERAVQDAVRLLEREGATVRPISLPHTRYALPTYYLLAPAEASSNLARYDGIRYGRRDADAGADLRTTYRQTRGRNFCPEVTRRIMLGTFALRSGYYDAYYLKAQKVRALIKRDFDDAFNEVDLVLSPTAPTAAFPFGEKASPIDMYMADVFTLSCNLAGLPGISVPCGFTSDKLPIGLQLLGPTLGEQTLIRAAAAYERATEFANARPPEASHG